MFLGPFPLDGASFHSISESSYVYNSDLRENCYIIGDKYYFRLKGEKAITSEAASEVRTKRWEGNSAANFALLKYGDKYLVIGSPSPKIRKSYRGILVHIAPRVAWKVESSSEGKISEADLYPFMLSATGRYQDRIRFKMVGFVLFFGINLLNYFRVFKRIVNLKNHPLNKRLGRYGDEPEVIASINNEVKGAGGKVPRQGLITPSWIIRKSLFRVELERNPVCKIE